MARSCCQPSSILSPLAYASATALKWTKGQVVASSRTAARPSQVAAEPVTSSPGRWSTAASPPASTTPR
ncbi:hypothetical protein BBK82_44925 [Lentzea guizhouensis]|uniref:Uncharacterized protein n=2 Tax=Lentzea guizhouensis TaxID=1586287 RepID=A0A1B2HWC5_9PSEU|nr:hypothetical protein BBK82_44925 [Lentzea guizhouensis]